MPHVDGEGREDLGAEDRRTHGEFALHARAPLLQPLLDADQHLDVHEAVTDLGVVLVVAGGNDVGLVALANLLAGGKRAHLLLDAAEIPRPGTEFVAWIDHGHSPFLPVVVTNMLRMLNR